MGTNARAVRRTAVPGTRRLTAAPRAGPARKARQLSLTDVYETVVEYGLRTATALRNHATTDGIGSAEFLPSAPMAPLPCAVAGGLSSSGMPHNECCAGAQTPSARPIGSLLFPYNKCRIQRLAQTCVGRGRRRVSMVEEGERRDADADRDPEDADRDRRERPCDVAGGRCVGRFWHVLDLYIEHGECPITCNEMAIGMPCTALSASFQGSSRTSVDCVSNRSVTARTTSR